MTNGIGPDYRQTPCVALWRRIRLDTEFSTYTFAQGDLSVTHTELVGLIIRSGTEALLWWSVRLDSLTEIDPAIRCDQLHLHLYLENRSGKKTMRSIPVDRLHGHLTLDKLPSGGRLSAAIGVEQSDGFTHIAGCRPVHLPSKSSGRRPVGKRRWVGADSKHAETKLSTNLASDEQTGRGRHGLSEYMPWEQLR